MFLMPSRYEPCGLNQLYSLKYGTVPIVRAVGGLEDTIIDSGESSRSQTGFKFSDYTIDAMITAISRAVAMYHNKEAWNALMSRCMCEDFSWDKSAESYRALYEKSIQRHEFR
jgi:starch synthase